MEDFPIRCTSGALYTKAPESNLGRLVSSALQVNLTRLAIRPG